MKAITLFVSTVLLIMGHGQAQDAPPPSSASWERLTMQPFLDAQGMMIVEMPFPPTWKVARAAGPGEPKITGPHGIQVFDFPGLNFLHTHDPRMRQVYAASGQPLRPVPRHSAPKSSLDEKLKNSLI